MQYANVDGQRSAPEPKLKGTCPTCGDAVLSKCGTRIVWHWAHAGRLHCDPWWENETPWHRAWKGCFPEDQREVVMFDDATGEKHVADVQTTNGMVIEFQNSPMTLDELRAREAFYGKMIWIVKASSFRTSFSVMSPLPDPASELASDRVFSQRPRKESVGMRLSPGLTAGMLFWRRSEAPGHFPGDNQLRPIHGAQSIQNEILAAYSGHHLFHWVRPREVWFEASKPVFLDFGDEALWWLQLYDVDYRLYAVRHVLKEVLVEKNGGDRAALPQADGKTPIHEQVSPEAVRALWATRESRSR